MFFCPKVDTLRLPKFMYCPPLPKRMPPFYASCLAGLCFLFCLQPSAGLFAQEAPAERQVLSSPSQRFALEISGLIFGGYELADRQNREDVVEISSPVSETTGFRTTRAYINLQGKITKGELAGWDFRITTDLAPAATEADGCASECKGNNNYTSIVKYVYFSVPLPALDELLQGTKSFLRAGQQHSPIVDSQSGISLQSYWGHRYITQAPIEGLGMSTAAERGLAFVHQAGWGGLHFLLGNGEGHNRNNGERTVHTQSLEGLRRGDSDSHNLDFYGFLSFLLSGAKNASHLSLNFPFRFHNIGREGAGTVTGTDEDDNEILVENDGRARQDVSFAVEMDAKVLLPEVSYVIAAGAIYMHDKRGPVLVQESKSVLAKGRDAYGFGYYGFAHVRWAHTGLFYRYAYGTAADSLDGRIEALEKHRDKGDGRFHKRLYGITYFPSSHADTFSISLGIEDLLAHKDSNNTDAPTSIAKRQTFLRAMLKF